MLNKETVSFIKGFLEAEFEDFNSNELTSLKEQVVNFGFKPFNNEVDFYNLKRYFKGMLDAEHITLKVDETTNKVIKCDAYASLVELYPELVDIINSCFNDDYMDNIHIEEGISITFNTWEAGAPASFTYNFSGKLISYYNAELGEAISYEDETEVYFNKMEEDVMNNETINVTVNDNMEDETMKNENINETAATTEETTETTMGEKAKNFAENAKEKLTEGFKFVTENIDTAADEVKKMANMNDVQLENYLKDNGKDILDKIVNSVKKYCGDLKKVSERHPDKADKFTAKINKSNNIVKLIKDVIDEEGLSGWGKFKSIVKEIVSWLLRLFLKVGAIVLKLAFTVVVGTIKIGATAIVTTGRAVGVLNKEVIKPTIKAGKKAWDTHKANMAAKKLEEDFEEETEFFFADDEDAE